MTLLNLTAAARVAGVNRSTIGRAVKSGRVSTTVNARGERCVDTAELMRAFGELKQADPADTAVPHKAAQDDMIEVLREQLRIAQADKERLLLMLEAEQAARRELEHRLLPAPKKSKKHKAG